MPVVVLIVVVSRLWRLIHGGPSGLVNTLLGAISLGLIPPTDWLGDPSTAPGAIFATAAILKFLVLHDRFLWPMMVTQEEGWRPVMVGLQSFFQRDVAFHLSLQESLHHRDRIDRRQGLMDDAGLWHLFCTGTRKSGQSLYPRIGHATSTDLHNGTRVGNGPALDMTGPNADCHERDHPPRRQGSCRRRSGRSGSGRMSAGPGQGRKGRRCRRFRESTAAQSQ
jgi:hypothetical protein